MSAIFNFKSLLMIVLLLICTCAYIRAQVPSLLNSRDGFTGVFWKFARVGERLSPYVSLCCVIMAFSAMY